MAEWKQFKRQNRATGPPYDLNDADQELSLREAVQLAAEINTEVERLIGKGKLEDALDLVNEAVRLAPTYPQSFANRADIFEQMGLFSQADADRARAETFSLSMGGLGVRDAGTQRSDNGSFPPIAARSDRPEQSDEPVPVPPVTSQGSEEAATPVSGERGEARAAGRPPPQTDMATEEEIDINLPPAATPGDAPTDAYLEEPTPSGRPWVSSLRDATAGTLVIERLRRLILLDLSVFDEVLADRTANRSCLAIVWAASVLAGLGSWLWALQTDGVDAGEAFLKSLVIGSLLQAVIWFAWVYGAYHMLRYVYGLPAEFTGLMRAMALAFAPMGLSALI
ncbi:MAG TPA: hypothetical protein VNL15_07170, partial [Dehalococcoidia bacterium]|nr:hypothetical protein [Dehalococcoidia bacterium]